jgi:hypothetical protein
MLAKAEVIKFYYVSVRPVFVLTLDLYFDRLLDLFVNKKKKRLKM